MLMSMALWADETVTVSANSSDISEGLDLKVVAKLFAEAENLEQFEMMLNNPDSAFCNLDLNGDGEVDYLRVVETGEGNKRLIVLQAVLAKDIYQDVASIYVEKDEKNEVSVQVVGDEYVYGENYVIEPVYIYRPVIYDWFWSDAWYAWNSPWYWGYWPGWWYAHACWTKSVKASVVGVMMADTMRMATIACLRQVSIILALISPILPNSQLTTGSSNTIPITRLIISSVSIYDCRVSMLATSSLT